MGLSAEPIASSIASSSIGMNMAGRKTVESAVVCWGLCEILGDNFSRHSLLTWNSDGTTEIGSHPNDTPSPIVWSVGELAQRFDATWLYIATTAPSPPLEPNADVSVLCIHCCPMGSRLPLGVKFRLNGFVVFL